MGETEDAKRWFSWPRFVESYSAGSPFLVMHTWCPPVRVGYGSRASGLLANLVSSEHFFSIRHFARETSTRLLVPSAVDFKGADLYGVPPGVQ